MCSNYFVNELDNLKNLKVIVALGKVAFDNCLNLFSNSLIGAAGIVDSRRDFFFAQGFSNVFCC